LSRAAGDILAQSGRPPQVRVLLRAVWDFGLRQFTATRFNRLRNPSIGKLKMRAKGARSFTRRRRWP
jgi:hypothetical protein